ncbi:putative baseplate assembly protein [Halomicrobium katesii]|uniref:putative baseplate assembly protein n=1 Tax=Halomicrobium katesii TaxID=437163 RepID=UPI00035CC741|nr:putative baseplate assembly protein [Halomicrobium katesii]
MTIERPTIDERSEEELFEALLDRAEGYTTAWEPRSNDVGWTLMRIFSTFERSVRKRLNEVPDKQLLAFLDALDFDRRRPQAARAPLSFDISPDLDRNVPIPGGTTAIAEPSDGENQQFELTRDGGFEATPAELTDIITVAPDTDTIVDHHTGLEADHIELFTGDNIQSHTLYMENESAFNLDEGSSFTCRIEANGEAQAVFDNTIWEYYGENPAGDVGWHQLEVVEAEEVGDDAGVEALQAQLRENVAREEPEGDEVAEQAFRVPGKITIHEVNGTESRWIRCNRQEQSDEIPRAIVSMSVHLSSSDREDGVRPDMMLSNDMQLSADDDVIRPFGRNPHPPVMFSIACAEALTKPGATVEISFLSSGEDDQTDPDSGDDSERTERGTGILAGPPQITWEYWNGEGWMRLESVTDRTDSLQKEGSVVFEVPDDIGSTSVAGHENVWIRGRLVSGNYGQPTFKQPDDDAAGGLVGEPDEPVYDDVVIQYEQLDQEFQTVYGYNNASYSENLVLDDKPFTPFDPPPNPEQCVYFGFDDTLENGPLTLFIPVEDATYPPSFDTGVQWEYCTHPGQFEWEKLDVKDQTDGLTERGIVMLTFPTPTTAFELFDRECHWIRTRLTGDEFDVDSPKQAAKPESATTTEQSTDNSIERRAAERSRSPPVLEGVYPNTQLAYNKVTVEDEKLGSSDGSHDQSFACAHAPVIDIDVWVDEFSTLSESECRRLGENRPETTQAEYDSRGELTAFWIQWTPTDDFLDSGPQDRHCVVNRTLGTVDFGDGDNGMIPPSGQDNIKTTYTTGGGRDGNVAAKTVTELKSSIALVDGVTNPLPADGGADIESTETLVTRSTNAIKHRNRAVTARDYENVAKAEFPELARVSCDPEHSGDQTRVKILIVPETKREKPVPSIELKHRVRETLSANAPAAVTADDNTDIAVRGPGYTELSIQATVRATNVKSVSLLKTRAEQALDSHLHPLEGNGGDGWMFGELPTNGELTELLADVESVTDVSSFEATFEVGGERHSLVDQLGYQALPEDTLICSGSHRITVTLSGD